MSATRPATEFSIGIMPSVGLAARRAPRTRPRRSRRARLGVRIGLAAGEVRIGARLALERDLSSWSWPLRYALHDCAGRQPAGDRRRACARAVSRSSGVSTPSGTLSTIATSIRMPASSARNCSSFSRCSSGEGGSVDEALQRGAAIGVEPDVMIERPVAGGRGGAGEIERAQPVAARPASRPPSPRSDWCAPPACTISAASVAMSTAGSASSASAAADVGRRERRQVALHVDHDAGAALRIDDAAAPRRCGRSRRHGRRGSSPRGRRPFPPPRRSPRNRSRPRPRRASAASARRSTCTIIGLPAMSASGLPGSRVAAMRAGIRIRTSSAMAVRRIVSEAVTVSQAAVIRVARGEANRVFVRRRGVSRGPARCRVCSRSRSAMDSFELNKIMGAVLGTCLGAAVAQYRRRRDLRAAASRKSPATRSRSRSSGRRQPGRAGRSRTSRSRCGLPAPMPARARLPPRNAWPATPSKRVGRTGSARTSTASSAAPRRRSRASTIRRR